MPIEFPGFMGKTMELLRKMGHSFTESLEGDPPLQAGPREGASSRDAVLVIDASPSMLDTDYPPSRLEAAKEAAKEYVDRLSREQPDAHVAIVAYNAGAETKCGLTCVRDSEALARAIRSIDTDSSTNITAGLQQALKVLKSRRGACQVVLLTDGEHNHGPKPYTVASSLRQFAIVETIGIGGSPADVNEKLLTSIASCHSDGTKRYRWIGDKERLVQHFHNLAGRITRR